MTLARVLAKFLFFVLVFFALIWLIVDVESFDESTRDFLHLKISLFIPPSGQKFLILIIFQFSHHHRRHQQFSSMRKLKIQQEVNDVDCIVVKISLDSTRLGVEKSIKFQHLHKSNVGKLKSIKKEKFSLSVCCVCGEVTESNDDDVKARERVR